MKALTYADANGKAREEELAGDLRARAEDARMKLCEAVAETDDDLLEKYLDQGEISDDELRAALRNAVIACKLTPVLCGSGTKNIGMGPLLDAIAALMPAPNERPATQGQGPSNGTPVERPHDPAAPFSALVFKTVIDPFAGKLSIMRVMSGRASTDATVLNSTRGTREHFGNRRYRPRSPAR
jgi:elongation factor G